MFDLEKKLALAKSRTERLRKSQRASEALLEEKSRELYAANQRLELAQKNLQTDIQQATYELDVANQRLKKMLDAKSRLISSLSHEIRTPLNAIIGLSELLEKDLPNGDNKANAITISDSANSMLALLNEMLEVMHIDIGQAQLKLEEVDVVKNQRFIESMFTLQMQQVNLQWCIPKYVGPAYLKFDLRRYNQVVNNLINNALKHTSVGTITLDIEFIAGEKPNEGSLLTRVIDSGIGIDKEDQKSIFDLYVQLNKPDYRDARGNVQSIGLGLPICKKLCELMMGDIACISEVDKGSEFSFEIPVLIGSHTSEFDAQFQEPPHKKLRILIAEDNLINQKVIRSQLEYLSQQVDIVDNGMMVLEKLKASSYDIVFLDIMMPELDGKETLKKIRQAEPRVANHYCVALTASSYAEQGEYLLSLGFDKFMSKPTNLQQLSEALSGVGSHTPDTAYASLRHDLGERFEVIFESLAPTYLTESKSKLNELRKAINNNDEEKINFFSHSLKSEARIFDFNTLGDMLAAIEKDCASPTLLADYDQLYDEWLKNSEQMELELQQILSKQ